MRHNSITHIFPEGFAKTLRDIQNQINRCNGEDTKADLKARREYLLGAECTKIEREIKKQLFSQNLDDTQTLAEFILERLLQEFVNNALDANTTCLTLSAEITNEIIAIKIEDNGNTEIPAEIQGKYSWRNALFRQSQKAGTDELGGCGLALAFVANLLEKVENQTLIFQKNTLQGACVQFSTSTARYDFGSFCFANYVLEMIHDLLQEQKESESLEKLQQQYKYYEGFQSKRATQIKVAPNKTPMRFDTDISPLSDVSQITGSSYPSISPSPILLFSPQNSEDKPFPLTKKSKKPLSLFNNSLAPTPVSDLASSPTCPQKY